MKQAVIKGRILCDSSYTRSLESQRRKEMVGAKDWGRGS